MTVENARILLAEHYEAHLLVSTIWLDVMGYEYDIARTAEEAIEKATSASYAVILMDVYLPDMGGYEVAKTIRQYEQSNAISRTPILGMNADGLLHDRALCLESGMDEYLLKPLQEQELRSKLASYIRS